jgi:hypothetical protein
MNSLQHLVYMVGVGCANMHVHEAKLQIARRIAVSDTVE